jgi:succinate-acetate transporter protein
MIYWLGYIGAIVLPLWNIPLIIKIQQRRSSQDLSLPWAFGVWGCLVAMLPSGLKSSDSVFRIFAILNLVFFTAVVIQILRFRRGR